MHNASPMKPCSRLSGRERWEIDDLKDNPRWAAAVEDILRTEDGVHSAAVNPLTGRVLVEFDPSRLNRPIEELLKSALAFGPMTDAEFAASRQQPAIASDPLVLVGTAELGCLFLKAALFGSMCPASSVAMILAAFLFRNRWQRVVVPPGRFVVNESSGVGHDENGAQVVQHCRDDRINTSQRRKAQADTIDTHRDAVVLPDNS
jgi:hypothetical protein